MTSRCTEAIPFSRPCIGTEEEAAVIRVLRSGWLTTGREALEFEREFAAFTGASHTLAVNSCTSGLHLSIDALDLPHGSLVATTPYTFAASAEVIRYVGCHPLFIDVEEDTCNMDATLLERALAEYGERISAVLPVHIAGRPCNMEAILSSARRHGIPVVEDAAHAFPVRAGDRYAGTIGTTGVYSFYANKTITTGEGGMIATESEELAQRMRIKRLHGIDRPSWDRYTSARADWRYEIVAAGYKYNLSDLGAAIGRVQLRRAGGFLEARRRIARAYMRRLAGCDFITLPEDVEQHAWHLFIVRLRPSELSIGRDEFVRRLQESGIGVSVHFIPLHVMPYYRETYGLEPEDFPVAHRNSLRSISLPIYPGLMEKQINAVVEAIRKIGYSSHR